MLKHNIGSWRGRQKGDTWIEIKHSSICSPSTQKHEEKIQSAKKKKMVPILRGATGISPEEVYQAQIKMLRYLYTWVC